MEKRGRLTQGEVDKMSALCNDTLSTLRDIVKNMNEERYEGKTEMEMLQWILLNYTQMLIRGTLDWASKTQ